MIPVTGQLSIDEAAVQFQYVQAPGPGGQKVNKVATAVILRFNLMASGLPEQVRLRLASLAGRRINQAGELLIQASRYRTQEQNRADALERLVELLRLAAEPPQHRRPTRPTLASKQKRLEQKHRRSELKNRRRERFADE